MGIFDVSLSSLISHLVVGLADGMIFVLLALGLSLIFGLLGIHKLCPWKSLRFGSLLWLLRIRPNRQLLAGITDRSGIGRLGWSRD